MPVRKRELGRTGLQVTTLGYGAMELRGAPRGRDTTEAQAETILNAVLDAGINYIDTSIDYGLSEERIGRYISHRRSEYYLASKCGCLVGAPAAPRRSTRATCLHPRQPYLSCSKSDGGFAASGIRPWRVHERSFQPAGRAQRGETAGIFE